VEARFGTGRPAQVRTPRPRSALERWGARVVLSRVGEKGERPPALATSQASSAPERLSWHSDASFETSSAWRVLYLCAGYPVIVERSVGQGSLVLVADAYPFSNEALAKERRAGLLALLIGRSRRVVFEESHLGVVAEEGVATLARRYRLTPFFLAAAVVLLLFVWKSGATLLPRREVETEAPLGRDSFSGLVSLLKRGIPERELARACLEEWRKTAPTRADAERAGRLLGLAGVEGTKTGAAALYRRLHRLLKSKEMHES
jgi:hypothetical protein